MEQPVSGVKKGMTARVMLNVPRRLVLTRRSLQVCQQVLEQDLQHGMACPVMNDVQILIRDTCQR